jgi:hypothetical protein
MHNLVIAWPGSHAGNCPITNTQTDADRLILQVVYKLCLFVTYRCSNEKEGLKIRAMPTFPTDNDVGAGRESGKFYFFRKSQGKK